MRLRPNMTKRQRSQISERELASRVGGRVQPASGALPVVGLKGDVVTSKFLIDDKVTAKGSFSVSLALWRKLRSQAFHTRKLPAISINFDGNLRLFVIDQTTWNKLQLALDNES